MFIFFIIIAGIFIIFYLLSKKRNRANPREIANIIERFINGKCSEWEWDDFISSPINNSSLDKIRVHCSKLKNEYPPTKSEEYINEEGLRVLRRYVNELRGKA